MKVEPKVIDFVIKNLGNKIIACSKSKSTLLRRNYLLRSIHHTKEIFSVFPAYFCSIKKGLGPDSHHFEIANSCSRKQDLVQGPYSLVLSTVFHYKTWAPCVRHPFTKDLWTHPLCYREPIRCELCQFKQYLSPWCTKLIFMIFHNPFMNSFSNCIHVFLYFVKILW